MVCKYQRLSKCLAENEPNVKIFIIKSVSFTQKVLITFFYELFKANDKKRYAVDEWECDWVSEWD